MTHYTKQELDDAALADLRSDVECSERYAAEMEKAMSEGSSLLRFGPNTPESYRAYAATCRAEIARYASGGAHAAVISGRC